MKSEFLMKAEIFIFLSFIFLFFIALWGGNIKARKEITERFKSIPTEEKNKILENELANITSENQRLKNKLENLENKYQENPPIIILSEENEHYRFELGSAVIPQALKKELNSSIIPKLDEWSNKYDCDAIMVIGHTDGVEIKDKYSNLDKYLNESLTRMNLSALNPGSNVDLGMMRAIAVLNELRKNQNTNTLERIKYWLPYSGGQLILTNDMLATYYDNTENKQRRKIEIILHKRDKRKYENND